MKQFTNLVIPLHFKPIVIPCYSLISNSPVVTKHALEEACGKWMKQFTNLIHKIEYFRRDHSHDVLAMFCSNSPVVPNTRSMWEMILFTKLQLLFIETRIVIPPF